MHIPMIVRWPRGYSSGLIIDELISQADIVPTIMSAVGMTCDEEVDGLDMGPALRGEKDGLRDHVLIECVDDPDQVHGVRWISFRLAL